MSRLNLKLGSSEHIYVGVDDGASLGDVEGTLVGIQLGLSEIEGFAVGVVVGAMVGALVGDLVGVLVGALVGALVGVLVGTDPPVQNPQAATHLSPTADETPAATSSFS
jgi:tetrahydromethanopterin S-methyltransferase subunit C